MRTDDDWILEFLASPSLQAATDFLVALTTGLRAVFPPGTGFAPLPARKIARDLQDDHPALSWGWLMIACRPGEQGAIMACFCRGNELVAEIVAFGVANHASARLAIWRDLANLPSSELGTDLFAMAIERFGNDLRLMTKANPLTKTRTSTPPIVSVLLSSRWDVAADATIAETQARGIAKERNRRAWLDEMALDHGEARLSCIAMAGNVRAAGLDTLCLTWRLLAVDLEDLGELSKVLIEIEKALRDFDQSEYAQLPHRLQVMHDIAAGRHVGEFGSLFHLAATHWQASERKYRPRPQIVPAPVGLLKHDRWGAAAADVWSATVDLLPTLAQVQPVILMEGVFGRNQDANDCANDIIDKLFAIGSREAGELALAWMMLMCEPRSPSALHAVLPQLQLLLDDAPMNNADRSEYQSRLDVWWHVAKGKPKTLESKESIFELAWRETGPVVIDEDDSMSFEPLRKSPEKVTAWATKAPAHSVVVLSAKNADRNLPPGWKDLVDMALPRIVAGDVAAVRRVLSDEYPHATAVIDGLLRDVREEQPIRMVPTLLVGSPGSGKSRLVRRVAEILGDGRDGQPGGMHVARFDASGSMDATWSGTPRAWASSHASVPATAMLSSRTANPIVLVDEIDKCGRSEWNGLLWSAILPYLDAETSGRHRETGLNSVLDLSSVSYIATANSVEPLPGPLRDRFRILRVPSPTLQHLPKLAGHVMREIVREDDARSHDEPLADDELAVIGRAWAAERFSMRKLQRIVLTTLEVRDQMARRH